MGDAGWTVNTPIRTTDPTLESVHGAFEAALVSMMDYYNHYRREQAAEIERLKAEIARLTAALAESQTGRPLDVKKTPENYTLRL